MEALFNYRIPVLHPLAVHFPLALLLAAALVAIVWMFRGTTFWRSATFLLVTLGAAGSFFAYFTGQAMKDQSEGAPLVDELIDLHEATALYTLLLSTLTACALGINLLVVRRIGRERAFLRIVLGLFVLCAGALVALTAHIGATMVWGVAH